MEAKPIYKTADDLEIEQWEHDGLVELVGPLSRGELSLNMRYTDQKCGTVACIGGFLAIRHGISWNRGHVYNYVELKDDKALGRLFFPDYSGDHSGWSATAPQAARAIVNFLVTGDPSWDSVMSEG